MTTFVHLRRQARATENRPGRARRIITGVSFVIQIELHTLTATRFHEGNSQTKLRGGWAVVPIPQKGLFLLYTLILTWYLIGECTSSAKTIHVRFVFVFIAFPRTLRPPSLARNVRRRVPISNAQPPSRFSSGGGLFTTTPNRTTPPSLEMWEGRRPSPSNVHVLLRTPNMKRHQRWCLFVLGVFRTSTDTQQTPMGGENDTRRIKMYVISTYLRYLLTFLNSCDHHVREGLNPPTPFSAFRHKRGGFKLLRVPTLFYAFRHNGEGSTPPYLYSMCFCTNGPHFSTWTGGENFPWAVPFLFVFHATEYSGEGKPSPLRIDNPYFPLHFRRDGKGFLPPCDGLRLRRMWCHLPHCFSTMWRDILPSYCFSKRRGSPLCRFIYHVDISKIIYNKMNIKYSRLFRGSLNYHQL